MEKIKPKHIIWLVIAAVLLSSQTLCMLAGLGIVIFVIRDIRNRGDTERIDKPPQNERLDIVDTSYEDIRLQSEITLDKIKEEVEIKRNTDIRQFEGRNDVSKEEVLEYMFHHDTYVGFEVQQIHLSRIQEVCNFSEEDRQWVTHELWGKTKLMRDEEGLAFEKYMNEKQRKSTIEIEESSRKIWNELCELGIYTRDEADRLIEEDRKENEHRRKQYMYDEWLKEKGYVT